MVYGVLVKEGFTTTTTKKRLLNYLTFKALLHTDTIKIKI